MAHDNDKYRQYKEKLYSDPERREAYLATRRKNRRANMQDQAFRDRHNEQNRKSYANNLETNRDVQRSRWQERYARLKQDPVKYQEYLAKKRAYDRVKKTTPEEKAKKAARDKARYEREGRKILDKQREYLMNDPERYERYLAKKREAQAKRMLDPEKREAKRKKDREYYKKNQKKISAKRAQYKKDRKDHINKNRREKYAEKKATDPEWYEALIKRQRERRRLNSAVRRNELRDGQLH